MIQIAIISNPNKISGKLTQWFTGSPAYHIGFTDGIHFWDQNLLFRRRRWPHYPTENVKLYRCPVQLTRDDLEDELDTSEDWYCVFDYMAFGIKKLFPCYRPSFNSAICSQRMDY